MKSKSCSFINSTAFNEWFDSYEVELIEIFTKVRNMIYSKSKHYFPITSVHIDDDKLFTNLVTHIYINSFNNEKHYRLRNMHHN